MAFENNIYKEITPERFKALRGRFDQFVMNVDKDVPVIQVYAPLRKTQLDELAVVREVSMVLQQKKDDDILKAKQAAEEASKAQEEAEKKEDSEETADEKEGQQDTNDSSETEKKDDN